VYTWGFAPPPGFEAISGGHVLFALFDPEFNALPKDVQDGLLAYARMIETFGPSLGRPWVDTLKASRHANMKELRFKTPDGVWRVALAFDLRRRSRTP
jgi:hypothetical protein